MANICLTEYVQVFLISYRQVTEEDGIVADHPYGNPRMHRTVEGSASLAFSCRWCASFGNSSDPTTVREVVRRQLVTDSILIERSFGLGAHRQSHLAV